MQAKPCEIVTEARIVALRTRPSRRILSDGSLELTHPDGVRLNLRASSLVASIDGYTFRAPRAGTLDEARAVRAQARGYRRCGYPCDWPVNVAPLRACRPLSTETLDEAPELDLWETDEAPHPGFAFGGGL